jgi:two-component system, LuxR family, sensor histidine kinase DctS
VALALPAVPPFARARRPLLWGALVALLVVAQSLLVALTVRYESSRAQDEAEAAAAEAAAGVKRELMRSVQALQGSTWGGRWRDDAVEAMRNQRALWRVERRGPTLGITDAVDTPFGGALFARLPRSALEAEVEVACAAASRLDVPAFSRTYFIPTADGHGVEATDLCIAVRGDGFVVGTFALAPLLDGVLPRPPARAHELSFVESDGTRLARAGLARGASVYVAERPVELPALTLQLRADATSGRPSLIPNLTLALVLGLSIALFAVVLLLARDVRRRARAERALAEALAFRKAMEDSLSTGLRARDFAGRITYVNPAFCAMVGFTADELQAAAQPPYWPPEHAGFYAERQRVRLQGADREDAREGYETVFMRKNGERFPVVIYEAPLVDGHGRHTGWMSAVLDISAQRRIEELSRQQHDRLQAAARLATVGEMASLVSHELNQPLAAIASYASGTLNLLADAEPAADERGFASPAPEQELRALLRQALERIAEQAERAGRVIKSVHHFVRRREQLHETVGADVLFETVLPLVRLQARKSGTRIELDLPAKPPKVVCDRTMVEQVLLNLTRNAIQAMETATPLDARVLRLAVRPAAARWVSFHVVDAGPGIAPDVAARLFTPFYTTRIEGMGLGLSLCRTVIEQHGGALDFGPGPGGAGTEFRFTLPARAAPAEAGAALPAASSPSTP